MMAGTSEEWHPGSFTKNYSWGTDRGLHNLYDSIRLGFADGLVDVSREAFRDRVKSAALPDYIPINFFLFNYTSGGANMLLADELVFQALRFEHSERFDHLALFALVLSLAGTWRGARPYQQRPALWAHHYLADRVGDVFNWDASRVSANDIERFVVNDPRYHAQGARKLATNLNFLFRVGGLKNYASKRVERWWVDALFLTLDRVIATRSAQGRPVRESNYAAYVATAGFNSISGRRSLEKDLALKHVVALFTACGGTSRFNPDAVHELLQIKLNHISNWVDDDDTSVAAVHPTNLNIRKTIPRVCAMLAKSIGFLTFDVDELAELNTSELVRENLEIALKKLKEQGIAPTMTAEDLMRLMRGE